LPTETISALAGSASQSVARGNTSSSAKERSGKEACAWLSAFCRRCPSLSLRWGRAANFEEAFSFSQRKRSDTQLPTVHASIHHRILFGFHFSLAAQPVLSRLTSITTNSTTLESFVGRSSAPQQDLRGDRGAGNAVYHNISPICFFRCSKPKT